MAWRISLDINLNLPGLLPFLKLFESKAMSLIDDLKASTDALVAQVEEGNAKTDQLILIASTTKDALVALQGQIGSGVMVTAADLQGIIDKQAAAVASINAQDAETDAAAVAVAP